MKLNILGILGFVSLLYATHASAQNQENAQTFTPDQRIAFYTKKLEQHPRLFAVYAQLAAAYLDKAREDLNPKWLKLADESLDKSIKIYPSFDAYKGLLITNAYRHRFAVARMWGEKAHRLFREDHEVVAVLVESDLGLGDIASARKRMAEFSGETEVFHLAVAMANILKAEGKYDEARAMFLKAEKLAQIQGFTPLIVWSRTNAAGMLIDSGRAKEARADLDAATAIGKGDPILRLHWSEYDEGIGETAKALWIVESMLEDANNPSLHARAYKLANKLGDKQSAQAHFAVAEKAYLGALDAGEIYPMGAIAQLYCDADVHLDKALDYATRNLEFKRDGEAQAALKCVQGKLKKPAKHSSSKA